ncbi:MAG: hypothetical protein IKF68_06485 [Erysipelotrichaceae bacterium]|nr:hypothetical protein [Erysipelotrichaceae bacterium]
MSDMNSKMTPTLESWRSGKEDMYERFLSQLNEWPQTGKEPQDGDQDIRFFLELEEKRLRKKGITLLHTVTPTGVPAMQTGKVLGGRLSPYTPDIHYRSGSEELIFRKDGKELYSHRKDVVFYETILNAEEGIETDEDHTCSCPNCGAPSFIRTLVSEGCPYCKTQFVMKDLYPKVVSYYTVETVPPAEEIEAKARRYPIIGAISGGSFALITGIIAGYLNEGIIGILQIVFLTGIMSGIGAFLFYILYSLSLLGRLLKMTAKALPMLPALGSDKKLNDSLSRYDPSFSVGYFSSKAISMFRTYAFSDDPNDLSFYTGREGDDLFGDLVHSSYKGGIGVSSIREEKGIIKTDLVLYLRNYYYREGRIMAADEKIKVSLEHKKDLMVDRSFSLNAVECKGCGGSFKAIYQKNCPYCGREYDIALNDWEMASIKR